MKTWKVDSTSPIKPGWTGSLMDGSLKTGAMMTNCGSRSIGGSMVGIFPADWGRRPWSVSDLRSSNFSAAILVLDNSRASEETPRVSGGSPQSSRTTSLESEDFRDERSLRLPASGSPVCLPAVASMHHRASCGGFGRRRETHHLRRIHHRRRKTGYMDLP